MSYEIKLLEANISGPMNGNMSLGLVYQGAQKAEMKYSWDETKFSAVFHGNAQSLPIPAHPMALLKKPIDAIYDLKTEEHKLPTDVFKDHQVFIDLSE